MNSIKSIPIQSKLDDSSFNSKSLDSNNNSWKLEKIIDSRGKANYKLINDSDNSTSLRKKSHKKKIVHKSIGAYGVPSNNAYMNNKATTLTSSIIKSVKRVKKNEISKNLKDISDEISSKSVKNDIEYCFENYAESENNLISKNLIVGINNKLISYSNGNDLINKSFFNGHLNTKNIYLHNINLLLSYFGKDDIPYFTLSVWSLVFAPEFKLVNIITFAINNLGNNKGKFINKEINNNIIEKGQIFVSLNFPKEIEGKIAIKYNIEITQIANDNNDLDINFEFPEFFNKSQLIVNQDIKDNQAIEIPKLSKNLFGNFIKDINENNIPIFSNKKKNDETNHSVNSVYAHQIKQIANNIFNENEDIDFTEKDDADVKNLINILKNE